jgi:8-oxo-dGTP diphosphatase
LCFFEPANKIFRQKTTRFEKGHIKEYPDLSFSLLKLAEELVKRKGSSIIFINDEGQILLFLRDNKPDLPYPNMWDIPGGHVEAGESPGKCIMREMKEEMDLVLDKFDLFSKIEFEDRIEYTFWARADLNIAEIELTEGQKLKWFTRDEAKQTHLAYGFNEIVEKFYSEAPFLR